MAWFKDEGIINQVKQFLAKHPKLSKRRALGYIVGHQLWARTNPPRKRLSGENEVARRRMQIEKGFIKANA